MRKIVGAVAGVLLLAVGSITGAVTAWSEPAEATPSDSQNLPPIYANWPETASNWPCPAMASYSCAKGGYDPGPPADPTNPGPNSVPPWPWREYGSYASKNQYGYHNCTLYAAFRLAENRVPDPGNLGNASEWAYNASNPAEAAKGIVVNETPAVGSIAQWNAGGGDSEGKPLGHVAYVEDVAPNGSWIVISEDNYVPEEAKYFPGGYTAEVHITSGSMVWPANFIHFSAARSPASPVWSPTWTDVSPQGASATGRNFTAVSCASATFCVAVGVTWVAHPRQGAPAYTPLVETYQPGGSGPKASPWTVDPVPNVGEGQLLGVSCVSTTFCVAVGFGPGPIVMTYNGSTWTAQALTRGPDEAVSCASAKYCAAVGEYYGRTAVATFNGKKWTPARSASPVGPHGPQDMLLAVSCPQPGDCFAVGEGVTKSGMSSELAEVSTSHGWVVAPAPGLAYPYLNNISCPAPSFCMTVGEAGWFSGGPQETVAFLGAGTGGGPERWRDPTIPLPAEAKREGVHYTGVSCPAPNECVLVGAEDADLSTAIFTTDQSGTWNTVAFPGYVGRMIAVSCDTSLFCMAVGTQNNNTVAVKAQLLFSAG